MGLYQKIKKAIEKEMRGAVETGGVIVTASQEPTYDEYINAILVDNPAELDNAREAFQKSMRMGRLRQKLDESIIFANDHYGNTPARVKAGPTPPRHNEPVSMSLINSHLVQSNPVMADLHVDAFIAIYESFGMTVIA